MTEIQESARRFAVGVCLMVASGDRDGAADAMRQYVRDSMESGHVPYEAMLLMTNSLIGLAVSAAEQTDEGAEVFFRQTALGLAVQP